MQRVPSLTGWRIGVEVLRRCPEMELNSNLPQSSFLRSYVSWYVGTAAIGTVTV